MEVKRKYGVKISKMWNKISTKIAVVVCLVLFVSPLVAVAQTTEVRIHIDSVMVNQTKKTLFTDVDTLHDLLTDNDTSNDPFIIDIRSSEHYELGHIDGAEHMSLFTIAKEENLAKIPENETVVVYCDTGQKGMMITVLLKLLGYENARNLKFGMQAWTRNDTVNPTRYDPATSGRNYEVVAGVETAPGGFPVEEINVTDLRSYIDSVMANQTKKTLFISVDSLHSLLTDNDTSNDPFIIDVRSSEHYELGHIDGAAHMSLFTIAKEENLAKIPENETVVVYCDTGQKGMMITVLLKLLGYENARNLKFGMQAWTQNDTVNPTRYDPATSGRDYEVVAVVVPTPSPTSTPAVTPTPTPEETPTPTPAPAGFEAVIAIAGLLAVSYILMRRGWENN